MKLNKAVFLDRDGVINFDRYDYTWRVEDFEVLDGVLDAMKAMQNKGYMLIIITNQGGISKNIYGHEDVKALHNHFESILLKDGITLTEIYYCPHHNEIESCICRKPESLLLEKAMARFNIDPALSYFVGDRDRDAEAGIRAGVIPIKIETNGSLLDVLDKIK